MKNLRLIAAICALMLVLTACSGGGQKKAPTPEAGMTESVSKPWEANILHSEELIDINEDGIVNLYDADRTRVLGSSYRRSEISSITFLNSLADMPDDAWDVSEARNGSVMAWVTPNGDLYDLYIAGEGGVSAGASCKGLFMGYGYGNEKIVRIDFHDAFHTDKAIDMSYMFYHTSVYALDLSSFNTSNVLDMSYMFEGFMSQEPLDLSRLDTSKVQNMKSMFYMYSMESLDLSSFDTSNVQNMCNMFCRCSLESLDLSSFNTSNVKDMSRMFQECTSLKSLDLSNFDTSNVQDMSYMFRDSESLESLNLSSFNTSNVQDMSYMFTACESLKTLDLSSFDISNVQDMRYMFCDCESMEFLNLSSFDTSHMDQIEQIDLMNTFGLLGDCPAVVEWGNR